MQERPRFYTLQQLVELTGFSRPHFYNLHDRGHLTLRKAGGRTVVLREDVDAWIAKFEPLAKEKAA
jgi:excisionase family DNA binding protein